MPKNKKGGWTIAKRYRNKEGLLVPGPGAYSQTNLNKYKKFGNKGVRFGQSGRKDAGDKMDTPGPGSFNIRSKLGGGYSFGRGKRKTGGAKENGTPGPGEYTLNSFKVSFFP